FERRAFFSQTHFTASINDEVDLFLFLVVPGHLSSVRIERHIAEREVGRLNRARSAHQVLCQTPSRIAPSGISREICNRHRSSYRVRRWNPPSAWITCPVQ